MGFRKVLRDFIIGKENFIISRAEYKSAMLRGQLCLVFLAVCLFYIVIDRYNSLADFELYYILGIITCAVGFWLNRSGKYTFANLMLLLLSNALIYVFASSDAYTAGASIYFIVASLVALCLFGFDKLKLAFLFCGLSLLLFLLVCFLEFSIVPMSPERVAWISSGGYERTSFIANFIVAFLVCCAIFYFMLDVNHYSENEILKKNEQLSKTNQELDRFVYSASHDLKAPLSSVAGLIELANRSEDIVEIKIFLEMMKQRVQNLDEFIREIIDYSRNSRTNTKKEKFNLIELTKEVVDDLRYAEGFENIDLTYKIDNNLEVESDRARLKVVFNNLIGNSLKYHDPAKENPLIEISATINDSFLQWQVQDNGLGIAEEHRGKIFEMFYRASEKSKGSGLGLYIVKETVERLGGQISVESQLHCGTRFMLQLPLA